jgi:hypothetical protein
MNNLATHQATASNSIAAACLARLDMKRELEVAPGYSIRKTKRTYLSFEYRDIIGNPCKRKDLSALYGTSESVVSDAYKKSEGNFLLANIKLMKRLRVK